MAAASFSLFYYSLHTFRNYFVTGTQNKHTTNKLLVQNMLRLQCAVTKTWSYAHVNPFLTITTPETIIHVLLYNVTMWQSWVEIKNYSVALLCSKGCGAKLPLRAGLIHAAKVHEYLISLCSAGMTALQL